MVTYFIHVFELQMTISEAKSNPKLLTNTHFKVVHLQVCDVASCCSDIVVSAGNTGYHETGYLITAIV